MDTTCNRVDMAVKASCKGGFYSGGFGYHIFKPLFSHQAIALCQLNQIYKRTGVKFQ